jgi:NADP-dependent 3-hydroxy acid dehydrogenase YdfG
MPSRTWFITGASRGFGRSFAQAALAAGDRVAATARDTSSLEDLVTDGWRSSAPASTLREAPTTDRARKLPSARRGQTEVPRSVIVLESEVGTANGSGQL